MHLDTLINTICQNQYNVNQQNDFRISTLYTLDQNCRIDTMKWARKRFVYYTPWMDEIDLNLAY